MVFDKTFLSGLVVVDPDVKDRVSLKQEIIKVLTLIISCHKSLPFVCYCMCQCLNVELTANSQILLF